MAETNEGPITARSKQRQREERDYVSVIIKRNDEVTKHPDDTLEHVIVEGEAQARRSSLALFLSAVSAGLIVGFSAMAVAFASVASSGISDELLRRLCVASVYPFGFIIVIMSGAQLFTEHTALAVYPFLDRRCTFYHLHRVWAIVLSGNLLGTFLGSILLYLAEPVTAIRFGYIDIANHLTAYGWWQIVISSVLAGWLMSLGGWLVRSTPTSSSQIVCIYIVTFLIGIGGLHHSIAGSSEVFTAFLMDKTFDINRVLHFLSASIIGNLFGGSVFVAILNYAHIRQTDIDPADEEQRSVDGE